MSASANPRPTFRGRLVVIAKAAVTVALLGWLFLKIDVGPVFAQLASIDPGWAVAAIALQAVQLAMTGWRWALICAVIGTPLALAPAMRLTFIGHFFSQTLPSAIGGDAVRAFLATREGLSGSKAAASVIIDRGTALVLMVALIGVLMPLFFVRVSDPAWRWGLSVAVGGALAGLAVFLLAARRFAALLERHRWTAPVGQLSRDFRRVLAEARESPTIIASAVAVHLLVASGAFAIARGIGVDIGLIDCWVLIPPVILLTVLPISVAGWGVREGAMVVALGFVGVPAAAAVAVSVGFGLVLIAVGLPGGVMWLTGRGALPNRAG